MVNQKQIYSRMRDKDVMNESYVGIRKAARMLNITERSLRIELKKTDCPYGYSFIPNGKRSRLYHVSRARLEKWIEEHPNKYNDNPGYVPLKILGLKYYSTEELIEELKSRKCVVWMRCYS